MSKTKRGEKSDRGRKQRKGTDPLSLAARAWAKSLSNVFIFFRFGAFFALVNGHELFLFFFEDIAE